MNDKNTHNTSAIKPAVKRIVFWNMNVYETRNMFLNR